MATRFITLNGSAAAWTDILNLTDYIGGLAVFTDTANKKLWGYLKEADDAELLGIELLDDGAFVGACGIGWTCGIDWTIAGGKATHDGAASSWLTEVAPFTSVVGKLYKPVFTVTDFTDGYIVPYLGGVDTGGKIATGTYPVYVVAGDATGLKFYCNPNATISFNAASCKEVTHLGIDAAHIVSAYEGVTQNWTGMDGGFDPNDSGMTLIVVLPFSIIRHPHFVVVNNLYSGGGGNIDVDANLLFQHHMGQGVKVKRMTFMGKTDINFVVIKERDENGPEICRLGSHGKNLQNTCYFKNGGSVMEPFIDVSECSLGAFTENRIIIEFDN